MFEGFFFREPADAGDDRLELVCDECERCVCRVGLAEELAWVTRAAVRHRCPDEPVVPVVLPPSMTAVEKRRLMDELMGD